MSKFPNVCCWILLITVYGIINGSSTRITGYTDIKPLASGADGDVFTAIKETGNTEKRLVVLKRLVNTPPRGTVETDVLPIYSQNIKEAEIQLLANRLDPLHSTILQRLPFVYKKKTYLESEYFGKPLQKLMSNKGFCATPIQERVYSLLDQMAPLIIDLNEHGVLNPDITANNIVVSTEPDLLFKQIDYGSAFFLKSLKNDNYKISDMLAVKKKLYFTSLDYWLIGIMADLDEIAENETNKMAMRRRELQEMQKKILKKEMEEIVDLIVTKPWVYDLHALVLCAFKMALAPEIINSDPFLIELDKNRYLTPDRVGRQLSGFFGEYISYIQYFPVYETKTYFGDGDWYTHKQNFLKLMGTYNKFADTAAFKEKVESLKPLM